VRPPARRARVVRPPLRRAGALVGAALGAAATLPRPLALLACARLLRAAARTAPPLLLFAVARRELRASGDLLGALAAAVADPAVWLPGIGLVAAAFVASAAIEVLGWSLGLPALRARLAARQPGGTPPTAAEPDAGLAGRFAALVQTGLLLLLCFAVWAAAMLPPAAIALRTWRDAAEAGGALLAAAALALVAVVALGTGLLLRLVADAAIARAGAFGDRPFAAIHAGAALVLRRPLTFLAALYLLALGSLLVAALLAFPAALAPPGAAALWVRVPVEVVTAAALAALGLARLGVFVGAAVDERPAA